MGVDRVIANMGNLQTWVSGWMAMMGLLHMYIRVDGVITFTWGLYCILAQG